MIFRCELASRKDPWWWVTDRAGYKLLLPLAIYRTTSDEHDGVIWSLIIGPVMFRIAYRASNKTDEGRT